MTFNLKKAILASVTTVGVVNSAAISYTSVFNFSISGMGRAHAGPNAASNNPDAVSPDADPFRAQTPSGDLYKEKGGNNENGTYFCIQVNQVVYTKVSGRCSGTYEAVTFMDGDTGRCDKSTRAFSGELVPLNEPINLAPRLWSSPPEACGFLPVWLLNARIPYTQQYDKCSCWDFGFGEFDISEVVSKHEEKALSTFHFNPLVFGDPNYFHRPISGPIKAALFMDGNDGDA